MHLVGRSSKRKSQGIVTWYTNKFKRQNVPFEPYRQKEEPLFCRKRPVENQVKLGYMWGMVFDRKIQNSNIGIYYIY